MYVRPVAPCTEAQAHQDVRLERHPEELLEIGRLREFGERAHRPAEAFARIVVRAVPRRHRDRDHRRAEIEHLLRAIEQLGAAAHRVTGAPVIDAEPLLRGRRRAHGCAQQQRLQRAHRGVRVALRDDRKSAHDEGQRRSRARCRRPDASAERCTLGAAVPRRQAVICRSIAHATCSRTSGDGSSARVSSASTIDGWGVALPSATATLRSHRS